ncbi:hypothetical protein CLU79DRAFT_840680 [Phycomyces nitens]|nr:hypothetical protein CLU79DRAFT_840680 [Phycomyces nitens]
MFKTIADELKYASLDTFQKEIKPDFRDKDEFLRQTIRFYWNFKCQLENTLKEIQNLQKSHKENLKQAGYSVSPPPLLSQVGNPNIVRLTEKEHCKGMAGYGPFDLAEHN